MRRFIADALMRFGWEGEEREYFRLGKHSLALITRLSVLNANIINL